LSLRGHELLPEKGIFGGADCQLSGSAGARQIERGKAEDRAEAV